MHHPTDRITHTTAFVTPVVEYWLEREIAQWVHPMKDRSNKPSHHEWTLYLWAMSRSLLEKQSTYFYKWSHRLGLTTDCVTTCVTKAAIKAWVAPICTIPMGSSYCLGVSCGILVLSSSVELKASVEWDVTLWYECWFIVWWVIGLILHGGSMELFLIPAGSPQLAVVCAILSVGWCI